MDARTGEEKWRFKTGNDVDSSPAVGNGMVYVWSWDNNFYAVDEMTGQEKWRLKTGSTAESAPIMADGVVYAGSNDNTHVVR